MRGRFGGLVEEGALILAAVFLGLNYVAIKIAVVSSVIVLHEEFGPMRILGAIILLAGVYLSRRG